MDIRKYSSGTDRPGLRQCVVALQDYERALVPRMPPGEKIADDYLADMFAQCRDYSGRILVAEQDGEIIGYCTVLADFVSSEIEDGDAEFAYVSDLMVLEHHRGSGTGQALISQAQDYARAQGAEYIRIGVLAANTAPRSLYQKDGFKEFAIQLEKQL